MRCPHCKKKIDTAHYIETVTGWVDLGKTNKEENTTIIDEWGDEISKETTFSCPNCGEDVTSYIKTK